MESRLVVKIDGSQAEAEARKLTAALEKLARAGDGVEAPLKRGSTAMSKLKTTAGMALKGIGAFAGVSAVILGVTRKIVGMSDGMAALRGQILLTGTSQSGLNSVFDKAKQVSNDTGAAIGSTIKLYGRLSRSAEELGYSSGELWKVTTAVNQSFIVSGASAQEAASATLQLSQGIASGTLRGEELNSVMENSPRLAKALADGMGIARGELRELGSQGKITGQEVVDALLKMSKEIDEDFKRMPMTVARSMNKVQNELMAVFGALDTTDLIGTVDDLAIKLQDPATIKAVQDLANGMIRFSSALITVASSFAGWSRDFGEFLAQLAGYNDYTSGTMDELAARTVEIEAALNKLKETAISEWWYENNLQTRALKEELTALNNVLGLNDTQVVKAGGKWVATKKVIEGVIPQIQELDNVYDGFRMRMGVTLPIAPLRDAKANDDQLRVFRLLIKESGKLADAKREVVDKTADLIEAGKLEIEILKATGSALVALQREQAGNTAAAKAQKGATEEQTEALRQQGLEVFDQTRKQAHKDLMRSYEQEVAILKLTTGEKKNETAAIRKLQLEQEISNILRDNSYDALSDEGIQLANVIRLKAEETDRVELLGEALVETTDSVEGQTAALREQEQAINPWQNALTGAVESIDAAFVKLWQGAFEGFDDFAKNLKDAFIKLLATLANEAITRPIVMTIAGAFSSDGSGGGGIAGSAGGANWGALGSVASYAKGAYQGLVSGEGFGALVPSWASSGASYANTVVQGYQQSGFNGAFNAASVGSTGIEGLNYAVAGDGGANLAAAAQPGIDWTNVGLSMAASFAGAYVGRQVFQNEGTTGIGAGAGGIAGGIIGGVPGAAIGAFLGEGLEKVLGDIFGFGGKESHNRVYQDLDLRADPEDRGGSYYTDKGHHKPQQDAVDAYSEMIFAFSDMIGGSDYSGQVSVSARDGFNLDGQDYEDTDQMTQVLFKNILAGASHLDANLKDLLMSFDGTADETATYAATLMAIFGEDGEVSDMLHGLIAGFDGATDELLPYVAAVSSLNAMFETDIIGLAMENITEQARIAGMTMTDVYAAQSEEVAILAGEFDGSTASLTELTGRFAENRAIAYELVTALILTKDAMAGLTEGSADYFRTAVMSEEQLLKKRLIDLGTLEKELSEATSPEEIDRIMKEYTSLSKTIFDSLKGDFEGAELKSFGEAFAVNAERIGGIAEEQLTKSIDAIETHQDGQNTNIEGLLISIGEQNIDLNTILTGLGISTTDLATIAASTEKITTATVAAEEAAAASLKAATTAFTTAVGVFAANSDVTVTVDVDGGNVTG